MENNYVLALDISGFCTGYAIWSLSSDTLSTAGYIPLKDKKDINSKVDKIVSSLETFQENTETISDVFIEDILTKFIAGKSSIKTIISLASINAVVQRKCYEIFGKTPTMINVLRARNLADCKVPKGVKSKDYILKRVCELHEEVKTMLPLMKTKPEFAKEAWDVADAVVVARAAASELHQPELIF